MGFNQISLREYFNYGSPTPAQIRERYQDQILDLNGMGGITLGNVLDAVITLRRNQGLILPDIYGRLLLQAPREFLDNYDPKYQHFIHWRYAPDVRLNTTQMSLEDAERDQFTLKSGIRSAFWDYEQPHRGFGIVDVRSGEYTLWSFLYLIEGIKTEDLSPQLIKRLSSKGYDVVGRVPKLTRRGSHRVTLRHVPYLSSNESYVLGTQLHSDCDCEWTHFGPRRTDKRRYVPGERMMCKHGIAFYKHLLDEPEDLLDILPGLTGIMNPWFTLKEKTIVNGRKLTKTRMNALLSMLIGYMGVERAFDLS